MEKTLSRQKEALLAEGKNDEAALFDRVPAQHLGSSYRNPHTMERIMEEAELAENLADEYADQHEEDFGEIFPQEWDELPLSGILNDFITVLEILRHSYGSLVKANCVIRDFVTVPIVTYLR